MENILLFTISYVTIFILYFIFFYLLGLKRKTILKSLQVEFLKIRCNIKEKDFNPKKIGLAICFIDPLIISLTGTIVSLPKWHYIISLLIGFVLLMALIYSFYEILGRILKRKIMKKVKKK